MSNDVSAGPPFRIRRSCRLRRCHLAGKTLLLYLALWVLALVAQASPLSLVTDPVASRYIPLDPYEPGYCDLSIFGHQMIFWMNSPQEPPPWHF